MDAVHAQPENWATDRSANSLKTDSAAFASFNQFLEWMNDTFPARCTRRSLEEINSAEFFSADTHS